MSGKKGMHNMGRPRTFDIRKEDLERLLAAGYGRWSIAKVYGCHDTTVHYWLVKYGLPTSRPMTQRPDAKIKRMLAMAAE